MSRKIPSTPEGRIRWERNKRRKVIAAKSAVVALGAVAAALLAFALVR